MRINFPRRADGLIARIAGWLVVGVLVLSGVGLNPFGTLSLDRPWSRCGLELCACQPIEPVEPYCPLCVDPSARSGGDEGACTGQVVLVREAERLGGDLPMIAELLSASLVLRLGSSTPAIAEPTQTDRTEIVAMATPDSRTIAVEPGPPRSPAASA